MRPAGLLFFLLLAACEPQAPPWHNHEPYPPLISGPPEVFAGVPATFDVTVCDPDGQRLRVYLAWGDGDTNDYGEFVYSGETVHFEHTYLTQDTFYITGRCHDPEPLFSDWSAAKQVVVLPPR